MVICHLAENITTDGFTLRLPRFGIFSIVYKPSHRHRIPLTGKLEMVEAKRKIKFRPLSELRELEHSHKSTDQ
jgi:nucleoid DNA-binding protein